MTQYMSIELLFAQRQRRKRGHEPILRTLSNSEYVVQRETPSQGQV